MINTSHFTQYSPNSEEANDDQPLDFSRRTRIPIQSQPTDLRQQQPITTSAQNNYLTTPSPSPPELPSNQVLCHLLTSNLIPPPTGKMIVSRNNTIVPLPSLHESVSNRFNGGMSTSQSHPLMQIASKIEHHNTSLSPSGSISPSPIGLGPLNQVDMHYTHLPNTSSIDRFGTSGGLLTTAASQVSAVTTHSGSDNKRSLTKYNRPFKAYPRDPLSIPMHLYGVGVPLQMPLTADAIATQSIMATASDQAYLQFREQMLVSRTKSGTESRRSSVSSNNGKTHTPNQSHSNSKNNGDTIGNNNVHTATTASTPENQNTVNYQNSNPNAFMHALPLQSKESFNTPKINGSAPMTAHHDETSQVSDSNSSVNLSGGEGEIEMGSMASHNDGVLSDSGQSVSGSSRKRGRPLPEDLKDDAYWERRRKNNEAAKRSRDARRAKEDEIAIRAAFLEQENLKLRCEVAALKSETAKLRCLLYNN